MAQLIDNNGAFDSKIPTNQGSWVQLLPGAPKFKGLRGAIVALFLLPDLCRTFYPQLASIRVRDAQHGPRFLAIQHEVCLLEQAANVGARVMPRHRMIGVAEQHLSILDGYTCGAQAAREGMSKIVNAHGLQSLLASRALPRGVVHRID